MQCRRNFLTVNLLILAAAIATALGSVFAAANAAEAQTVVHVRTADLKVSDTANVKIEPVHYGYGGGYYHSYYRAPYGYGYYGRPYRGYYGPYRAYGGAYAAWYGNPYYSYPYYTGPAYYSLPYYGPSYYGSYYGPSYYGSPYSAYNAPLPSVGVYVGPRPGLVVRRGSFYW